MDKRLTISACSSSMGDGKNCSGTSSDEWSCVHEHRRQETRSQRMRAQEERCHAMGDIRGMVQTVALNHDPSQSSQVKSFGPVTKYVSLLPNFFEPTDPHDFQSRPYSNGILLFLKRPASAIPLLHSYPLIGPRPPPSRRRIEFLRQESQVNHFLIGVHC